MPITCSSGCGKRAMLKRPKTGDALCKECFYWAFEEEVHHTITAAKLFHAGEHVAIAASGGKDSTVLAHLMTLLNERYHYGLKLVLLSVDEGITGYRDDSLETVKRNEKQYGIPLKILSYEELYGWTMDKIVQQVGRRNNCTFCGVFRRQALDRGAQLLGVDKLVTGHNADDIAETIIMNILRGDVARLQRCCAVETGSEGSLPRSKPFKYTYEKEIVMYAYFKKLDYFSTECIYSPNAYRGHARAFIKDLEKIRPSAIIDIIHSGECLSVREGVRMPTQSVCSRCGHVSSQEVCKACVLLEGLNRGKPRLGVGKSAKVTQRMKTHPMDLIGDSAEGDCADVTAATVKVLGSVTADDLPKLIMDALALSHGSNNPSDSSLLQSIGDSLNVGGQSGGPDVRLANGTSAADSDSSLPNGIVSKTNDADQAGDILPNGIISNEGVRSTGTRAKAPKRVFSPRKKFEVVSDVNSSSPHDGEQQALPSDAVPAKGKCSSLPTSIEDIGNGTPGQKVCSSGGQCSADCKNKKARKVVSLKNNPDSTLKAAGISKKDLDF